MKVSPDGRLRIPALPDGTPVRVPAAFVVAHVQTGAWRLQRPVVDVAKCSRCGICERYCPLQIISVDSEGPVLDLKFCKGCGICANECPKGAMMMVPEEREDREAGGKLK